LCWRWNTAFEGPGRTIPVRAVVRQVPKSPAWFDLPKACLGALVSATIVAWINVEHGYLPASTAALKQAFFAFFAVGLILRLCQWLASRPVAPALAVLMALLIPLLITTSALYGLHSFKGTPEPFYSTLTGALLGLSGFVLVTWRTLSAGGASPLPADRAPKAAP
jgi:hypothetical protein